MCVRAPVEARRGHQNPGAGITSSCLLPNMGTGNHTLEENQVLLTDEPAQPLLLAYLCNISTENIAIFPLNTMDFMQTS